MYIKMYFLLSCLCGKINVFYSILFYYKATAGNARCERCPDGQTTASVGGTKCISGQGLPKPPPPRKEEEVEATKTPVVEVPLLLIEYLVEAISKFLSR